MAVIRLTLRPNHRNVIDGESMLLLSVGSALLVVFEGVGAFKIVIHDGVVRNINAIPSAIRNCAVFDLHSRICAVYGDIRPGT